MQLLQLWANLWHMKFAVYLKYSSGFATVSDCLNALISLISRNKLELRWVLGHGGIQGNEIADQLAKKGTEMSFYWP